MNKLSLFLTVISGLSTLLGYFIIFIKNNRVEQKIVFYLSLSLGIMTIVSIFELLPTSVIEIIGKYNVYIGILFSTLVFYLGYLTIQVIDINIKSENNLKRIGVLNLISLMVHNIPEDCLQNATRVI